MPGRLEMAVVLIPLVIIITGGVAVFIVRSSEADHLKWG